eukprot:CAMPEP_0201674902 /NCGR_PEP_ID=MMETSP0494-20130426/38286_1 /ASSEMBLY_ACC=CAM_ASM_000839 /TAXON_ID=420259 /ORGANISM="Thalassiosira gravida, Strain GMp14c1" /LENGTH=145 /DNA_ID=CAMNT_0048157173 /DNA_START=104 /DNA_END=538 /DNA_ORIENTATION=-
MTAKRYPMSTHDYDDLRDLIINLIFVLHSLHSIAFTPSIYSMNGFLIDVPILAHVVKSNKEDKTAIDRTNTPTEGIALTPYPRLGRKFSTEKMCDQPMLLKNTESTIKMKMRQKVFFETLWNEPVTTTAQLKYCAVLFQLENEVE